MAKKKLAVFCDGTWNDLRMQDRTNVSRLAKCIAPAATDGTPQIVFYDEGVGVGADVSKAADELMKLWGGAFGRGLDRKIEAAYRFLVTNYQPGDDIYVFGFSRGAYTARSLCGLIRKCGILKRECFDMTPAAMENYRKEQHPRAPELVEFRKRYSHPLATGSEEDQWRDAPASPAGDSLADLYQYRPAGVYRVMYLGLWDTVGSMGVPDRFKLLQVFNRKYDFHDTKASQLLASIRHAVAADEDRKTFSSTGIENIDELNRDWARARGFDLTAPGPTFVPMEHRPYQQLWFPGDHGAVGGGNPQPGLSSRTLLWIAEGAARAGLTLVDVEGNELGEARRLQNHLAQWRVNKDGTLKREKGGGFLGDVGGYAFRAGPGSPDGVSDFARRRWCDDGDYRPQTLNVLKGQPCPAPGPAPAPEAFPRA